MDAIFPYDFDHHDLMSIIINSSKRFPKNTAVSFLSDNEYINKSYEELERDIKKVSSLLRQNCYNDSKVILCGQLSYIWIVAFFAILNINSIVVCCTDELQKSNELPQLLYDSKSKYLMLNDTLINSEKKHLTINQSDILNILNAPNDDSLNYDYSLQVNNHDYRPAVILFTSGTTGKAKPVCLSHNNISNDVLACQYLMNRTQNDRIYSCLPVYHSFELTVGIFTPLFVGAMICISNGNRYIFRDMKEYNPTIIPVVPLIANTIKKDLSMRLTEGIVFVI